MINHFYPTNLSICFRISMLTSVQVNESLYDTSVVISSMVSAMVARVGPHSDIAGLAKDSSVPVINALSDDFHPMQIIADFLTIHEAFPPLLRRALVSRASRSPGLATPTTFSSTLPLAVSSWASTLLSPHPRATASQRP